MRRVLLGLGVCALALVFAGSASAGWHREVRCERPVVVVYRPVCPPVCVPVAPVPRCDVVVPCRPRVIYTHGYRFYHRR
jgi:hypothetical protein